MLPYGSDFHSVCKHNLNFIASEAMIQQTKKIDITNGLAVDLSILLLIQCDEIWIKL
jgi:hypothetical protein